MQKHIKKIVLVLIALAALGLAGWLLFNQQVQPESQESLQAQPQGPTKEEILESLSVPSGNPPPTEEERQEILEGLAAPASPETSPPTEEEKRALLESLSKPNNN